MKKYQLRNDPNVIVEAEQFNPNDKYWPKGVIPWPDSRALNSLGGSWGYIDSGGIQEDVYNGDYIVYRKLEALYPVRRGVFNATYLPVTPRLMSEHMTDLRHTGGAREMKKYQLRNDPNVIVNAIQFNPDDKPWPEGIIPWPSSLPRPRNGSWGYIGKIRECVFNGDYIVYDQLGALPPVREDVFERKYCLLASASSDNLKSGLVINWIGRDNVDHMEVVPSSDELALRVMRLLMSYLDDDDVLKITIGY